MPIEGIQIGEHRFEYSKYLSADSLCDEVGDKERDVFAIKAQRTEKFDAALAACDAAADGNRHGLRGRQRHPVLHRGTFDAIIFSG